MANLDYIATEDALIKKHTSARFSGDEDDVRSKMSFLLPLSALEPPLLISSPRHHSSIFVQTSFRENTHSDNAWPIDRGGERTEGWVDEGLAETSDGDDQAGSKILDFLQLRQTP
ncbi:hypothetical protein J3458_008864 [Metarhizium acridum]|uniref:uncharacterized protein n=1 Tax=Metarhizium acridum TaxID=92637 RepID=UPI001C6BF8C4|nr:hypothetical protein J3458_008864 [Metarhizium acridum]